MTTTLPAPGDPNAAYFFDLQGLLYPFWSTQAPWAARKFIEFVRVIMRERKPAFAAFAADLPFPTFRHDLALKHFGADRLFKGDRKQLDPAKKAQLLEQLRIAEELLADVFGISTFKHRGAEADDIVATFVDCARAQGMKVVFVAHDRDLMQLVDEPNVVMWDGRERITGRAGVMKSLGVNPEQVVDYFAIAGGKNNIPGVYGLGEKAAVEILRAYGTLEKAIAAAEKSAFSVPTLNQGMHKKFAAGLKDARASAELARLDRKLPLAFDDVEALRIPSFADWD